MELWKFNTSLISYKENDTLYAYIFIYLFFNLVLMHKITNIS